MDPPEDEPLLFSAPTTKYLLLLMYISLPTAFSGLSWNSVLTSSLPNITLLDVDSTSLLVKLRPETISNEEQDNIKSKLGNYKLIFFSSIAYDTSIYSEKTAIKIAEIKNNDKLLLAGIAKPKTFFAYLQNENDILLKFSDHHHFTDKDILYIKKQAKNNIIITTEKDFVRLNDSVLKEQLFYLPIHLN